MIGRGSVGRRRRPRAPTRARASDLRPVTASLRTHADADAPTSRRESSPPPGLEAPRPPPPRCRRAAAPRRGRRGPQHRRRSRGSASGRVRGCAATASAPRPRPWRSWKPWRPPNRTRAGADRYRPRRAAPLARGAGRVMELLPDLLRRRDRRARRGGRGRRDGARRVPRGRAARGVWVRPPRASARRAPRSSRARSAGSRSARSSGSTLTDIIFFVL